MMITSVLLVVCITGFFIKYIFLSKNSVSAITILPIKGRIENVEYLIRNIIIKSAWEKNYSPQKIILVDMGSDSETLDICKAMCAENDILILCKPSEIAENLNG